MMNQEDLFRKLGSILNELNDQYEYLAQNPQQFNELELELFLANASFLTDHIQIIRKLNQHKLTKELPEHTASGNENIQLNEPLAVATNVELQSPKEEFQEPGFQLESEPLSFEFVINDRPQAEFAELPNKSAPERPYISEVEPLQAPAEFTDQSNSEPAEPEIELEKEEVIKEEEVPEEPRETVFEEIGKDPFLIEKEEDKVPAPSPTLVVDAVEEKVVKPTLNDLLANTRRKDSPVSEAPAGPPIKDLKQAINLNDKLLYIKDLFNGYNLAYSEAIDIINKMPDFNTADAFLKNNYAIKNNWAAKQTTVDKFYALLQRRFN